MVKEPEEPETIFTPGFRRESSMVKGAYSIEIFEQITDDEFFYRMVEKNLPELDGPKERLDDSRMKFVSMPQGNCAPILKPAWFLIPSGPIPYDKELWQEIKGFIYEHLFLPDENLYDVLAAWIMASWVPEVWTVIPYIFFYGPVASGKTRGLEVLHRLGYRAILSSNISSAALFRACDAWKPTLILDETEIYNKADRNEVIGLLNSGYRRGQYAIRVKSTEHGEVLECFDVFGFKALAGTEGLAKTLESRSIMIRMLKNRRKVRLHINETKADELRGKLLKWRFDKLTEAELSELSELFLAKVGTPELESGRLEELFQCLLAVSNDGRENILNYAKKMAEIRQFEEMTSLEADIVEAMLNLTLTVNNGVILTKDVAKKLNESRLDKEQLKTNSVGWIIRRLGFEPRHTEKGNGWFYDQERLNYLKSIYLGSGPSAKKSSETSETSAQIECPLCLKAIPEDHKDTTVLDGKYVHIPCMLKLEEGRKNVA